MIVLIENDISGQKLLLIPQEDGPNDNISCTFILLSQEDGHKFWVHILTTIYDHEKKLTQYPGNMYIIFLSNYYQYEGVMPCNNIANHIVHTRDEAICVETQKHRFTWGITYCVSP